MFENNLSLVETAWTKAHAPADAWILANGLGPVYLSYFGGLRPLNLRYYTDEAMLHARLDALAAAGEVVYVSGRTFGEAGLRAKLERYGLTPVAADGGLSLFRVQRAK